MSDHQAQLQMAKLQARAEKAVKELLMVISNNTDELKEQIIELSEAIETYDYNYKREAVENIELKQRLHVAEANLKIQTEEAIELRHKWAIAEEFISAEDMVTYRGDLASYNNGQHHLITRSDQA